MIVPIENIVSACKDMESVEPVEGLTMIRTIGIDHEKSNVEAHYQCIYFKCFGGKWHLIVNEVPSKVEKTP